MSAEDSPAYLRGLDDQGRHHRIANLVPPDMLADLRAAEGEGGDDGLMWFTASTDHLDRYETIVEQDWLEGGRMQEFARNPVVLWAHDYSEPPIGRVMRWQYADLTDGHRALLLGVKWDEGSERGAETARQYREGFMHAVSVGWEHTDIVPLRGLDEDDPRRSDRGWLLRGNRLWELSAVPVPGNSHAVKRSAADLIRESAPGEWRSMVGDYLRSDEGRALLAEAMGEREREPKRDPLASMFGIND